MNEKELLDLLAEDAPLLPADYPLTTLRRARRARRVRALAISGGTMAVVALLLFTQLVLRPSGGPSLPPADPGQTLTGIVYLEQATAEQRSAVRSTLDGAPGMSKVDFVSREEAYERFAKLFKEAPDMVGSVGPAEMPESYQFEASAAADLRPLLHRLRDMPGVAFAVSPMPQEIPPGASPSPLPMPEMGLPEALVYSEQLLLLAAAVWQNPTPPKTVYIVDRFCLYGGMAGPGCTSQGFSPLLRSELQSRLSGYAEVVFVEGADKVDPIAPDALVVAVGPLPPRDAGDQTLWIGAHWAEHSEFARFEVAWDGERWVVGQWVAGSVT